MPQFSHKEQDTHSNSLHIQYGPHWQGRNLDQDQAHMEDPPTDGQGKKEKKGQSEQDRKENWHVHHTSKIFVILELQT